MSQRFAGKKVVITGGNSGIGLATAQAFAREGAQVAIIGRSPARLAAARDAIGGNTLAISADMSRVADIPRAMAEVHEAFGSVDVLFANAGTGAMIPFEQVDEALWDQVMSLNVKGTYFTVQHCLPLMGAGGAVVLRSSVSAARSLPGSSVYAASKAAINSIAAAWRVNWWAGAFG